MGTHRRSVVPPPPPSPADSLAVAWLCSWQMRNILEEVQIEIIKNSLFKLYLEDFYRVCMVRQPNETRRD